MSAHCSCAQRTNWNESFIRKLPLNSSNEINTVFIQWPPLHRTGMEQVSPVDSGGGANLIRPLLAEDGVSESLYVNSGRATTLNDGSGSQRKTERVKKHSCTWSGLKKLDQDALLLSCLSVNVEAVNGWILEEH